MGARSGCTACTPINLPLHLPTGHNCLLPTVSELFKSVICIVARTPHFMSIRRHIGRKQRKQRISNYSDNELFTLLFFEHDRTDNDLDNDVERSISKASIGRHSLYGTLRRATADYDGVISPTELRKSIGTKCPRSSYPQVVI